MCKKIYSAHTLAHTKPFGRQFLGKHIYIYDAHTLAHTRALMCTKVYIYSAHTLAHIRFAQACFSRPLGGNRFAGYAIPLGRAYPAHTQKCVFKGLEGPLALERAAKGERNYLRKRPAHTPPRIPSNAPLWSMPRGTWPYKNWICIRYVRR